mmetsp:Transcript_81553/g.253468  ORF Transcript_81553/g.253468 Transcript_81553/m.253468 type:complete len:201 (-) Transcript_81553:448-1050(-)
MTGFLALITSVGSWLYMPPSLGALRHFRTRCPSRPAKALGHARGPKRRLASKEDHNATDVVVRSPHKCLLHQHPREDLGEGATLSLKLPGVGRELAHALRHKLYSHLVVDHVPDTVASKDHKGVLRREVRRGDIGHVAHHVVRQDRHLQQVIAQGARHGKHAIHTVVHDEAPRLDDTLALQRVCGLVVRHGGQPSGATAA